MTFTVETGAGTPGANALCDVAFVTAYLTARGRETTWAGKTTAEQQAAIVTGTDYMEARFGQLIRGQRAQKTVDGRSASGRLTFSTNPTNGELVVIGQKSYRLVAALAQENDILIGATVAATVANIIAGVELSGLDTTVHKDTQANYEATTVADATDDSVVVVVAREEGVSGNLIVFTTTTSATITGSGVLAGGIDEGSQPLMFPRVGLRDRDGELVEGVPERAKQACALYSNISLSETLLPNPEKQEPGAITQKIERSPSGAMESTSYEGGGGDRVFNRYPEADALMAEYVEAGGGVQR